MAAETGLGGAEIAPVRQRPRLDRDRPLVTLDRLLHATKLRQDIAPVFMSTGVTAIVCDGAVEARECLLRLAELGQRTTEQHMRPCALRLHRQRAPYPIDALGEPALLTANLRKGIERGRVGGIMLQHARITVAGVAQRTLAMKRSGLNEQPVCMVLGLQQSLTRRLDPR